MSIKLLDCTAAVLRSDIRLLQFAIQHANLLLGILEGAKTADDLGPSIALVDAGAETFVETLEAIDVGLPDPFTAHLNGANLDMANRICERLALIQGTLTPS